MNNKQPIDKNSKKYLKQLYNNRLFAAKKKLKRFKIEQGIPLQGIKLHEVIYQYSIFIGKPIENPTKKGNSQWLYELYSSGEDELVRKNPDSNFYTTGDWIRLRREVLKKYGYICMKCKCTEYIHVDHIFPRSLYPEKELEFDNMQVLCRSCNCSKNNKNTKDYRGLH